MDRYCRIRTRNKGVVSVGNMTTLNRFCSINCIDKITIGNSQSLVSPLSYTIMIMIQTTLKSKPIIVGNNVWIDLNVIILKGSVIGDNAVNAAGAAVKNIVKENEVFFGIKNESSINFRNFPTNSHVSILDQSKWLDKTVVLSNELRKHIPIYSNFFV